MAKIGRNEPCPCRSGKKYKHCCGNSENRARRVRNQISPQRQMKVTLMDGVKHIQDIAAQKKAAVREIGVFFFYSTIKGDAWLLEMTECDCVKLSENGVALKAPIDENSELIEVNWSHSFTIKNKGLELTSYTDKNVIQLADAPSKQVSALLRRLRKNFSEEQLQKVHLNESVSES